MRLMIVDDEEYTREGIKAAIDWEKAGFDEVMLAKDGAEAYMIARWFKPDLILTDIKMPIKDGISFTQEILQHLPRCKFLFMSSYVEIEYFKSALKLSVIDYIIKPIDKKQLQNAVQKAVESISTEKRLEEIVSDNKALKRQRLVRMLLGSPDESWVIRECKELQLDFRGAFLCIVVKERRQDCGDVILGKIDEILDKYYDVHLSNYIENVGCTCILGCSERSKRILQTMVREILQSADVMIGIGITVNRIMLVNQSYASALRALDMSFYEPENRVYEINETLLNPKNLDPGLYNQLTTRLQENPEEVDGWFANVIEEISRFRQYRRENILPMFASLVRAILHDKIGTLRHLDGISQPEEADAYILSMESFQDLKDFLFKILDARKKADASKNEYSRIVQGILEYVDKNYDNSELSIQEIADYVHLSTTYLNIIFKKEVKITLKLYISNYRIEKAKKMLLRKNDRIVDIAEKCGYTSANYFARVFKESEGMTPVEYREKYAK